VLIVFFCSNQAKEASRITKAPEYLFPPVNIIPLNLFLKDSKLILPKYFFIHE